MTDTMKPARHKTMKIVKWIGSCAGIMVLAGCSFIGFNPHGANVVASAAYCGTTSQEAAVHYFATQAQLARWVDYRGIDGFDASAAANGGVIVVEMGQRMTSGYTMETLPDKTHIEDNTLYLGIAWMAPPEYAAISQAMTSPCMVIAPPPGDYNRVVVVDQLDNVRGSAQIN